MCSAPRGEIPVPPVVAAIAAGRGVAAVWLNELGGVTFRIGSGPRSEFVKITKPEWSSQLVAEAERLRWAVDYAPVPTVLGEGDGWLHTAGMPGSSAVDPRWVAEPLTAARAIGSGLRRLHDVLPVEDCPFDWSADRRLAELPPHRRADLADVPPIDRLVVCHGDACAPNTLISDSGRCAGHVDLGDLGIADRWADLAVATLSLRWNYSCSSEGSWEDALFDAYGIAADPRRIDYYRRLWQAGDAGSR